jgi:glycerol uptake facilitator-like aquaporin
MQKYIIELIGSFFLMMAISFTGNAIAIGFTLVALVYFAAPISGAHFNPAVTLAVWINGGITLSELAGYITSQVFGVLFGALFIGFISSFPFTMTPSDVASPAQYASVELLFTFFFVLIFVTLSSNRDRSHITYFGIAVGFAYAAVIYMGEPISGGAFNPAIALGSALSNTLAGGRAILYLPMYMMATLLGGLIAGYVSRYFAGADTAGN